MKNIGRVLAWAGLLAVTILGIWIFILARQQLMKLTVEKPLISLPQPQLTPTIYPSSATIIESVQSLSRLETASYHIEKVITAESGQGPLGFLFGDKLLLIAYGEVIAGVDLGQIGPEDVLITPDGTAYIHLPPVEVFVATLDNQRTYVYDRRTGVGGLNPQLETAARQEAERLILQAAIEDGLETKADENARDFLRSFLIGLNVENVIFVDVLPTLVPTVPLTPTMTPAP